MPVCLHLASQLAGNVDAFRHELLHNSQLQKDLGILRTGGKFELTWVLPPHLCSARASQRAIFINSSILCFAWLMLKSLSYYTVGV